MKRLIFNKKIIDNNYSIEVLLELFNSSLSYFINFIYPKLYRIDQIQSSYYNQDYIISNKKFKHINKSYTGQHIKLNNNFNMLEMNTYLKNNIYLYMYNFNKIIDYNKSDIINSKIKIEELQINEIIANLEFDLNEFSKYNTNNKSNALFNNIKDFYCKKLNQRLNTCIDNFKDIYPNCKFMYNVNYISNVNYIYLNSNTPLSLEYLRFNQAYILDNSKFITIILFSKIKDEFIQSVSYLYITIFNC